MIFYVVITACCSFACQLPFVYLFARFKFLVSKMSRIEKEVKKKVLDTWLSEKGITMRKLAKRFGIHHASVKTIINKFGEHYTLDELPGRGRKPGSSNPKLDRKVVSLIMKNKSMSIRDLAKKAGTSVGMIQRIKQRNHLKTYKKQKISKQSAEQKKRAATRARKLYSRLLQRPNACALMDDETYVKEDSKTLPGPQYFTAVVGEDVSDADRSIQVEKFGRKVLVWQAICTCGLKSTIFYTTGTINAEIYRSECLQKRLLPLYKKHSTPPLFWPDLASAHYAKTTLNWLAENGIDFVEKNINPPNCPQLRPIERYWAIVKRVFKKTGKAAGNMQEFKKKIWAQTPKKGMQLLSGT